MYLHQSDASMVAVSQRVYKTVAQGSCPPGSKINSLKECSAAAQSLSLIDIDTWATDQKGDSTFPPGCYVQGRSAKFNGGTHNAACTSENVCLCIGPYLSVFLYEYEIQ